MPITFTQRFDIITDLNIQIIDIEFKSVNQCKVRVVNVYNEKALYESEDRQFAIEKLMELDMSPNIPTILVGDWNTKHPNFCIMPNYLPHPSQQAVDFVHWIHKNGFTL
jgi:hypothetical protein